MEKFSGIARIIFQKVGKRMKNSGRFYGFFENFPDLTQEFSTFLIG